MWHLMGIFVTCIYMARGCEINIWHMYWYIAQSKHIDLFVYVAYLYLFMGILVTGIIYGKRI